MRGGGANSAVISSARNHAGWRCCVLNKMRAGAQRRMLSDILERRQSGRRVVFWGFSLGAGSLPLKRCLGVPVSQTASVTVGSGCVRERAIYTEVGSAISLFVSVFSAAYFG